MKLPAALLSLASLAACQTADLTHDTDLGDISPAVYLMDGYVELPAVRTLDQCGSAVRAAAAAPNPKALGTFMPNPQSVPNAYLGGCSTSRGYFYVSPAGLQPYGQGTS